MKKKGILAMVSGLSALALAATCGSALAFGHSGHQGHPGHGDKQFFVLAHAAGITGAQIHQAFQTAAPTLKNDFTNLIATKKAMDTCIISASCNSGQIAAFATAQSTLTQDKLGVWQKLFSASGVNNQAAESFKSSLDSLNAQKHQLMHSVFSSAQGTTTATPSAQE